MTKTDDVPWISLCAISGKENVGRALLNLFFDRIDLFARVEKYVKVAESRDFLELHGHKVGFVVVEKNNLWEEFEEFLNKNKDIFHLWSQVSTVGADRRDIEWAIKVMMATTVGFHFKKTEGWDRIAVDVKQIRRDQKKAAQVIDG